MRSGSHATPRAAWARRRRGAGSPSASTGRRPTGSGRGAPRAGLAGQGRERAVPGDRRLRAWAHLPRDPDSDLGHPQGAPFGWPPPPDPAGSQGEPLRLEGAGRSAAPLPGDARRPPGGAPGACPAPRSPRTVSWRGSGPGGSLRGGGPRGSQAPPGPARGGLPAALCCPPGLAPGVSAGPPLLY